MLPVPVIILLVVAFLCANITPQRSFTVASVLSEGEKGSPRTALVLTGHPDDESMFFAPTVLGLVREGWEVRVLCLSVGDAGGLGRLRRGEIEAAMRAMGVPGERVTVIDDPNLPDTMSRAWDVESILSHLSTHLSAHPASLLLTFDPLGVSRHPNHASLPLALLSAPAELHLPPTYVLRSSPLPVKYTGPFALFLRLVSKKLKEPSYVNGITEYLRAVQAMLRHDSQMVWFRWLYVVFSRYMWVNEWTTLDCVRPVEL